jgi:hypothetical protein
MRSVDRLTLSCMFAVGLLSGCSGSDSVPITAPSGPAPGGPTAAAEDQRDPQSDELTSEEAALVSQADSEPDLPPKQDL